MGMTRRELEKKIAKKELEITDLRRQVREAEVYVGALHDVLKMIPKGAPEAEGTQPALRPGSALARAREAIQKAGRPLHVAELLKSMGLPNDRKSRGGLSGTLSPYVRRGEVFTRPAPNTFGLRDMEGQERLLAPEAGEPPESFGRDDADDLERAESSTH